MSTIQCRCSPLYSQRCIWRFLFGGRIPLSVCATNHVLTVSENDVLCLPRSELEAEAETRTFYAVAYTHMIFLCATLLTAKLALLFLYRRLFEISQALSILICAGIAVCLISYTGLMIAYSVACFPRPDETHMHAADRCNAGAIGQIIACGVVGLVTDVYLLILPVRSVWRMNISLKRRLGVLAIFGSGLM